MSQEDAVSGRKNTEWTALEIVGSVRNLSPHLWEMNYLTVLYLNNNNIQRLPPDIGRLTQLTHLDLSNNKLRILPPEIGELICLKELLLDDNNLRALPFELGKCFRIHKLGLEGNSLGNDILQLFKAPKGTQKLLSYLLDILSIQNPAPRPSQRPWILMDQPIDRSKPSCMFTVMCYNVLCDKYATRQLYGYCPSWALKWEYRRHSILEELRANSADVIALQEVETGQYHDYFLRELQAEGYEGIFSPKSRAKTMSNEEKKHVDGCAIFYRTSKFSLISEHLIEFNQLAMANAEGSDDMLNRVMTKDNIALAALLQIKEGAFESLNTTAGATGTTSTTPTSASSINNGPGAIGPGLNITSSSTTKLGSNGNNTNTSTITGGGQIQLHQQRLLVCTAHIHWDPEFCDVKIIQTIMLTHELQAISNQAAKDLLIASGENINLRSHLKTSSRLMNRQQLNINLSDQNTISPNSALSTNMPASATPIGGGDDPRLEQLGADLIPLILCGDFNSLPESSVFEFLSNGVISADHQDFKELAYKDCLRKICNSRSSAMANSQHSQQSHQYSGQTSKSSPNPASLLSESVDEKSSNVFDDSSANNGNGGQRKLKNGANHLHNSNDLESNNYTHPFPLTSAYSGEGSMPFTNYV